MSDGEDVVALVGITKDFYEVGSLRKVHGAFMIFAQFRSHSVVMAAVSFVKYFPFMGFSIEKFEYFFIGIQKFEGKRRFYFFTWC